jgi:hypothetical protein
MSITVIYGFLVYHSNNDQALQSEDETGVCN